MAEQIDHQGRTPRAHFGSAHWWSVRPSRKELALGALLLFVTAPLLLLPTILGYAVYLIVVKTLGFAIAGAMALGIALMLTPSRYRGLAHAADWLDAGLLVTGLALGGAEFMGSAPQVFNELGAALFLSRTMDRYLRAKVAALRQRSTQSYET